MKRIISIVCCVIMLMSSAYTVSATEIGDMQNSYTTLSVEFSDNIGQNEDLDIFVKDEHVYANAEQLGERREARRRALWGNAERRSGGGSGPGDLRSGYPRRGRYVAGRISCRGTSSLF